MWSFQYAYKCTLCGSNAAVIHQMHDETEETRDICEDCAEREEAEYCDEEE